MAPDVVNMVDLQQTVELVGARSRYYQQEMDQGKGSKVWLHFNRESGDSSECEQ